MQNHRHLLRAQRGVASLSLLSFLATATLLLALFVAYQFVDPAPPKKIVLATGAEGGAYQRYGESYAQLLAEEGIEVELRQSAGAAENLAWLNEKSDVDIAFVQSGLAGTTDVTNVMGIGSLYLEPLWLFVDVGFGYESLPDLASARLSVGEIGSGTRAVAERLLSAHGIHSDPAGTFELAPVELAEAFADDQIDAAFVVADPLSDVVTTLIESEGINLVSLERSAAYARRSAYLTPIVLPTGVLNLESDLPATDITTVAPAAMLLAQKDLHPALVDLLLVAAADIHGGHGLLSDAGAFPSPRNVDVPLSEEAERHFRRGPPFLMRYLPFWAATLVDRIWVLALPLLGLAIPLFKLVPPAYQWQVRRRFVKLYVELESLDPSIVAPESDRELNDRLRRIERLERESASARVPREYKDGLYKLRRDIDLVRRRLLTLADEADPADARTS